MSKIDKDALVAEIKFRKSVYDNPNRVVAGVADAFRQDGRAAMCDDILKYISSLPDEPASEDLEKEIARFTTGLYNDVFGTAGAQDEFDWDDIAQVIEDVARHFAEWQKAQIMKGAVEGKIIYDEQMDMLQPWCFVGSPFHVGDKVKVIVIKEEKK